MKKLLSLPPNLVDCFHDITGLNRDEWFCTSDPVGKKLGSGGGTVWLLSQYRQQLSALTTADPLPQRDGGKEDSLILIHAGGQSRRLPAYAPSGKILTPIPIFRWERGQRLSQDLLSLQVPLYEQIMREAPATLRTMVVSGDVYIRATQPLQPIPDADVVCYGLWLPAETAKNHGVFVSSRQKPSEMEYMLQKPSVATLGELSKTHLFLTDIGIWLLSDRAVEVLTKKCLQQQNGSKQHTSALLNSCTPEQQSSTEHTSELLNSCTPELLKEYDLYSDFGRALGTHPVIPDDDINQLTVAILPLPGGEFYHFGTSHDIIGSTLALQNLVNDQREIMHHSRKPHPSMFVQNTFLETELTEQNQNIWIENSWVGLGWKLSTNNIVTGVPENNWQISLRDGQCVDIVPIGDNQYCVRPYGFDDAFRGSVDDESTRFLGQPFCQWAADRRIDIKAFAGPSPQGQVCDDCAVAKFPDLQQTPLFPVVDNIHDAGLVLRWMLNNPELQGGRMLWNNSPRLSAEDIANKANMQRLMRQRADFRADNWRALARNHAHSVFYQVDLEDAAREFHQHHLAEPLPLSDDEPLMKRIHDSMFRAELARLNAEASPASTDVEVQPKALQHEERAFALLREGLTASAMASKQRPRLSVYSDQIVWGRSPVRIDIAGGWTDTPPYCLMEGGNVVNLAIELNGQPPLQAYVKPCREHHIVLRSIDLGAMEIVESFEQLAQFHLVGSPFSIPKAALALAGFLPDFCVERYDTLARQLEHFGCGIELTLLSAIPAGSGLGTSSLLASTVLGALSDFCGLAWDKSEIGHRTLVLEQLLTTGGGWQDQFGGLLHGVKLLQTHRGFDQNPEVRWLPDSLFTQPEYEPCHLLYYTGITRTAKTILADIVRRMFLNQHDEIQLLRQMQRHALDMYEAIQRNEFEQMGRLIGKTWQQNQLLDSGTNPAEVQQLTRLIDDFCLGYKLPGAGGGGYLYMVAKDAEAAARIKQTLNAHRLHANARFVDMSLSTTGLQVSRS